MFARILCFSALLTVVGCAALDDGYTTHYGLTSTESPQVGTNPAGDSYRGSTVDIQEMEEYEEKYRERDVIESGESGE